MDLARRSSDVKSRQAGYITLMFGFLRPGCLAPDTRTKYRQVYAAYCSFQRQRYGALASLFTSYEAVALYLLAIESGACQPVSSSTPVCCRFRNDWKNNWQIDVEIAEFCAAYAMLLASVKIEDDKLDTASPWAVKSIGARSMSRILRKSFDSAKRRLDQIRPGMVQQVQKLIAQHHMLETSQDFNGFEQYAQPTADAFAVVYDSFADLLQQRTGKRIAAKEIGFHVGRSILLSDCLVDRRSDLKRGEFNPIRTKADSEQVRQLALASLSTAGWLCIDLRPARKQLLPFVFKNVFRRIAIFEDGIATGAPLRGFNRRGECDCACGICCECCGHGDICCDAGAEDTSPVCANCCFHCGCDLPCEPGNNSKQKKAEKDVAIQVPEPSETARGTTVGPLNPSGVVEINGMEHPAKTSGEFIESGVEVEILESTSFGFIVRRKS